MDGGLGTVLSDSKRIAEKERQREKDRCGHRETETLGGEREERVTSRREIREREERGERKRQGERESHALIVANTGLKQ